MSARGRDTSCEQLHKEDILQDEGGQASGADEDDEEIWWAWEGKIVGFADW